MSVRNYLPALLLGFAATSAAAQDAQSLVAKNLEARGGAAATRCDQERQLRRTHDLPGRFRADLQGSAGATGSAVPRSATTSASKASTSSSPMTAQVRGRSIRFKAARTLRSMSADEARQLADAALIEGPLLASRSDGSKVDYLGRDDFDGTLAYKLKVTQKDGDEFVYWLDPDTYLEIKVDETRRIRGAQQTTETELGDYEKIAGVYFPMSVESWSQGHPERAPAGDHRKRHGQPADCHQLLRRAARCRARPPRLAGEPPDASNKRKGKPAGEKPTDQTTPPSSPPKGK